MTVLPEETTPEITSQGFDSIAALPEQTRRDLGRLSVVTDGLEQENDLSARVERILDERERPFFEQYARLAENERLARDLEGDLPLGQRRTFAQMMYGLVRTHAAPFWKSESGKHIFNQVPEKSVRLMMQYFYHQVGFRPVTELGYRRQFKPVAVRLANHYPEVHFADRLHAMLSDELSDNNVQTQAANDLITILGMAIDAAAREK